MVSTAQAANSHVLAKLREKKDGKWQQIATNKPQLNDEYNAGMLRVDKSDQLIGTYNVLRKCVR